MPSLAAVLAVNSRNAPHPPTVHPVAVVVGATSGIGRGVVESIARHTNGSAHIVLVGRNKAAADEIIAGLPQPVDGGKYEFVPCDVSSMKQVGVVTRDLASRLDKINYLAMSPGFLSMGGRTPTEDGVDRKIAVHYYGRFKFAHDLAPLLAKAADQNEPARVVTILDSLRGGPMPETDNMTLVRGYSLSTAAGTAITYNNSAMVAFAKRYPSVSFIHAFPGFVNTGIASGLPFGVRHFANLFAGFATSVKDSGEFMSYSLFDPALATPGAYFRNSDGSDVPRSKYATSEAAERVWNHSVEICANK